MVILLTACVPHMDDNSLEAVELSGVVDENETDVTGVLTATPGDEEGDWALAIDDVTWTYHSPSRADLSSLDGETLTVALQYSYSTAAGLTISDAEGPRFVETSSDDGTLAFGHAVWKRGEVIGEGVIVQLVDGVEEEEQKVQFTDVIVATDDGEQRMRPGEPATVPIDGSAWRFTVLSAYLAVNRPHLKCGAPDMLSVELLLTETEPGPPLFRTIGRYAPVGSCG